MSRQVFTYDPPERFVVGTVGQPGERVFYLQARDRLRITTVKLEKEQVAVLAEKISELLDEIARRQPDADLDDAGAAYDDLEPLDAPIVEDFVVGALGLGWNSATSRVVVEAHASNDDEVPEIEDDSDVDGPDCLRLRLTAAMARAFVRRASAVVAAGRPPCPLCHLPLDPAGHICPRANGYRR
ncbi:MAG: DUF3090 family protein [Actinomycetes bacterium]